MAVTEDFKEVTSVDEWYDYTSIDQRDDTRQFNGLSSCARMRVTLFEDYKREMTSRVSKFENYEKQAAAEFVSAKPDLPNVSSGETAGFIRRMARNTVQHTPNVEIRNQFDDNSIQGILAQNALETKVIGDDEYSNDMQQNLITTVRRGFTLGFDCVIPVLNQDKSGKWRILYDTIHYKDVFPEPGAKDIRRANDVYIRRYLTKGDVARLIRDQPVGWDVQALRALYRTATQQREFVDHENKKTSVNSHAYEVITWYNSSGQPFLTWAESTKLLLRIETNKHPLKEHPVHFFVPERDEAQPLGKSLLSLTYGRQEFQDLFLNGAMKLWWRNVNPPILGYGTINAIPNLSPNAYTQIANPNAKVEAFEVNPQALMMFGNINQQNAGSMVQLMGAADQQMAMQSGGGGMSQTPQGVEAQQQMVDITTNNYQKAVEVFFSKYCSYALTIYWAELKGTTMRPSADVRKELLGAGLDPDVFDETGAIKLDWKEMVTMYYVNVVPGSLIERAEEKQSRMLNEMFIPFSQALPAIAQTGDVESLKKAAAALMFIVRKQVELSDSQHKKEIGKILGGEPTEVDEVSRRIEMLENRLGGQDSEINTEADLSASVLLEMQKQISLLGQGMSALAAAVGVPGAGGGAGGGAAQPALDASATNGAPGAPGDPNAARGPEAGA